MSNLSSESKEIWRQNVQGVNFIIVLWADYLDESAQIGFSGLLENICDIMYFVDMLFQKR